MADARGREMLVKTRGVPVHVGRNGPSRQPQCQDPRSWVTTPQGTAEVWLRAKRLVPLTGIAAYGGRGRRPERARVRRRLATAAFMLALPASNIVGALFLVSHEAVAVIDCLETGAAGIAGPYARELVAVVSLDGTERHTAQPSVDREPERWRALVELGRAEALTTYPTDLAAGELPKDCCVRTPGHAPPHDIVDPPRGRHSRPIGAGGRPGGAAYDAGSIAAQPVLRVLQAAMASPAGVTATEGNDASVAGGDRVVARPKEPPSPGRVAARTEPWRPYCSHTSVADALDPPARSIALARRSRLWAGPNVPPRGRVKTSSLPPNTNSSYGLTQAIAAEPSAEKTASTSLPSLRVAPPVEHRRGR